MIPPSRYSAMRILGSSPEVSEIYMTSREVNIVQRNGEGIYYIIMMDGFSKIRCSPCLCSIALNGTRTTDRVVTSLTVENSLDRILLPLRSSRKNWNRATIVTSKCFVTMHATLKAVTTTGGRRHKNSRVGFNIMFQGDGDLQPFSLLFPVQRIGGLTSDEIWLSLSAMLGMNWLLNSWKVMISKPCRKHPKSTLCL